MKNYANFQKKENAFYAWLKRNSFYIVFNTLSYTYPISYSYVNMVGYDILFIYLFIYKWFIK